MRLTRQTNYAMRILMYCAANDGRLSRIPEIAAAYTVSELFLFKILQPLVEHGLVERVASPVPRRDYYRFKPGGWIVYMRQWLGLMSALHQITERGLALMEDQPSQLKERLQEAHDLFSFIEQEFPALLKRLETERNQRPGPGIK